MSAMKPLILLFLLGLSGAAARADTNPGVTAAPVLQIPVGARAAGMGTAFTGLADDISALNYNPAGLSLLRSKEAYLMYLRGLADQNIEYLAFGGPLPFPGLTGSGFATMAGSLLFSQNGSIQINTTNPDGSAAGSQTLNAGGDLVATAGYAERLAETSFESGLRPAFHVQHFIGFNGKLVRSTLAEQYSATAWAADFGYLARSPELGWSAGASLLNVGTRMTFISEGDPLPLTVRAGGAYRWARLPFEGEGLTLAVDEDYSVYDRSWHVNAGTEYRITPAARARLGYQFNHDVAGLTAGFGFEHEDMTLDYAWTMDGALSDTHRLGFTYRFGAVSGKERAKRRAPRAIETFPEPSSMKELEPRRPQRYELPKRPRANPPPSEQDNLPVWIY